MTLQRTLLRHSTNNGARPDSHRFAAVGSVLLAAVSSLLIIGNFGCRPNNTAGTQTPKAVSKEATVAIARGYVRLDDLIKRHPLQSDVQRLTAAQKRLASLVPQNGNKELGAPYTLSPLVDSENAAALARTRAEIAANRQKQRERLLARAALQFDGFLAGLDYLQEQLLARRRAELEAAGRADQERAARDVRDQEAANVRSQIASQVPKLVNGQLPVSVLSTQLLPSQESFQPAPTERDANPQPVIIMNPVSDQDLLAADVKKLNQDPKVSDVSVRARFIVKLRAARQKLRDLRAEIDAMIRSSNDTADTRILALRDARLAEIEMELESLRDDNEGQFLVRSQRTTLQKILAAEEALAAGSSAEFGLGKSGNVRQVAGATQFASLFGTKKEAASISVGSLLDIRQAIDRIAEQRTRLQRFIKVDVQDAVQDVAAEKHYNISYAPETGRTDMTVKIANLIEWDSATRGGAARSAAGG